MSLLDAVQSARGEGSQQPITGSLNTGGSLLNSVQMVRGEIQPTQQIIVQPEQPQKTSKLKSIGTSLLKFGARTGIEASNLISQTADFALDILSKGIENTIRNTPGNQKTQQIRNRVADKWRKFYEEKGGEPTNKLKNFTENLRRIEYIQPSKEWTDSSTKEKFTKRLPETILNIGPGIISSLGAYVLNPVLGFAVASGSVADDVRTIAVENGVPEEKAQLLGLGTGLLVGWIDKIVPDEVLSPQVKKKFISGFVKRIVKAGLKEAGTEVVQEDIQLLAEATVREDITKDEVVERNLMSGLGGLLGGSGMQTLVTFTNSIGNGDIGGIKPVELENGKFTPQEVFDQVLGSELQETTKGQQLIKTAIEAEQTGQMVQIKDGNPQVIKTEVTEAITSPLSEKEAVGESGELEQSVSPLATEAKVSAKDIKNATDEELWMAIRRLPENAPERPAIEKEFFSRNIKLEPTGGISAKPQPPSTLKAEATMKLTPLNKAMAKFDKTGTADVITGKDFGITVKDEGDFISVRYGSNSLTPVGSVPSGEKNFATKEEAFNFVKQIQDQIGKPQIDSGLNALKGEATKYKSAEEFVKDKARFIHETSSSDIREFDMSKIGSGQGAAWLGNGIYLQEKGTFKLEKYGPNKVEAGLSPDAKIFKIEDTPDGPFRDNFVEWYNNRTNGKLLKEALSEGKNPKNILPRDLLMNKTKDDPVLSDLLKEGYDGLIQDGELVIYNPKAIKTKSQLTDIFNQAVTKEPSFRKQAIAKEKAMKPSLYNQAKGATGEAVVIDPDKFKKQFNDFDPANHEKYSQMAKDEFARQLKVNKNPIVKFTAGGSGSGKSEQVVGIISEGFDGIIYDGTFSNYNSAIAKINQAIEAGKQPEVWAILPDIERAWRFVNKRGRESGRFIPKDEFIGMHMGFIDTLKRIIKNNPEIEVYLKDTRKINNKQDAIKEKFEDNPKVIFDILNTTRYNKNELESKLSYEKNKETTRTLENQPRRKKAESETSKRVTEKKSQASPRLDRGDQSTQKVTFESTVKTSGLAKGVKSKAIKNKLIYGFDKRFKDLPDYDVVKVKEQRKRAIEFVLSNPEEAFKVAMGEIDPPSGILPESVFVAVEDYATQTNNVEAIRQLATQSTLTNEATVMGQRIRLLGERNPDSVVGIIQKIKDVREERVKKITGKTPKQAIKQETDKIKIKKPDKGDWASFIKNIQC